MGVGGRDYLQNDYLSYGCVRVVAALGTELQLLWVVSCIAFAVHMVCSA